jgi:hypothetical protein
MPRSLVYKTRHAVANTTLFLDLSILPPCRRLAFTNAQIHHARIRCAQHHDTRNRFAQASTTKHAEKAQVVGDDLGWHPGMHMHEVPGMPSQERSV